VKEKVKKVKGLVFFLVFTLGIFLAAENSYAATITASLEMGGEVGLTEVTAASPLSPDEDGTNDYMEVKVNVDADGDVRIIVDTDRDSSYEPITDWSVVNWCDATADADDDRYAGKFDYTMSCYTWSGTDQWMQWWGRDNTWSVVPAGTYNIRVEFDGDGDGVYDDATAVTFSVVVSGAGISGTVTDSSGDPVAGAEVNAGSMYSWGWAYTDSSGNYTLSGLRAGGYHMEARMNGYVTDHKDNVTVIAGAITASQDFTLGAAVQINGTVTIPEDFDAFTNRWGWEEDQLWIHINAWNPTGSGWGWDEAIITASTPDLDADTSSAYAVSVEPGTYNLKADAEGYASQTITGIAVAADGTLSGDAVTDGVVNLTLTKAKKLSGTVNLPAAADADKMINVCAWTSNRINEAWGGGQIANGATQGTFDLWNVLPGTYTVRIEVVDPSNWMPDYMAYTGPYTYGSSTNVDTVTVGADDVTLNAITMSAGESITGTITITGGASQAMSVWINCWSHDSWGGFGTNVQFNQDDTSVDYTINGLGNGTYYIDAWVDGYEISPRGLQAVIPGDATGKDLTFTTYNGVISGTVSGFTDHTNIIVIADQPSGWGCYAHQEVQIDAAGAFTITGLGTGDYMVKANQYEFVDGQGDSKTIAEYLDPNSPGITKQPDGTYGTTTERALVANGETTTVNIALSAGLSISGSISIDSTLTDKDWALSDLVGSQMQAFPMQMQMMGMMSEMNWGTVAADGTYTIGGLSPGTYIVEPPMDLGYIDANGKKDDGAAEDHFYGMGGDFSRDCAYQSQTVTLSDASVTGVNFTLSDGYDISGTITIPTAPTNDWEWIGDIGLDNMTGAECGMGMFQPVQGYNFTAENEPGAHAGDYLTTYSYTVRHVLPGDYTLRFWTDKFVCASREIEITNANLSNINLTLTKGAIITGKLVDGNTGKAVTSSDGVSVRSEARPWVEGSWRSTVMDIGMADASGGDMGSDTGRSYIVGADSNTDTPGKFYLKNLPEGNYVVVASTGGDYMGMRDSSGVKRKNYASVTIAGVTVSETNVTNEETIDVGTIKMEEGLTLTGRVWLDIDDDDTYDDGEGLANVPVEAEPADMREGDVLQMAWSKADGTYEIVGVDSNVQWWEVVAAIRPCWHDHFMVQIPYGEKAQLVDVSQSANRKDINFQLSAANVSITGVISKAVADPDGNIPFALPSFEEGNMGDKLSNIPAVMILLQKAGEIYDDPMEGFEEISDFSDGSTATFTIDNLEEDTYVLKVFCPGFDTYTTEVDASGDNLVNNVLDVGTLELEAGGTVSGTVRLDDGTKPSLEDVQTVVAMKTDFSSMVFGKLVSNSSTRLVSEYEIKGILPDVTYYLIFVANEGKDIYIMGDTSDSWTVTDAGPPATYSYEAVITLGTPFFELISQKNDDGDFELRILSTLELVDTDTADSLDLVSTTGTGTLRGNVASSDADGDTVYYELMANKREIRAFYTPAAGETSFVIAVTGHRAARTGETTADTAGTGEFTIHTAVSYTVADKIEIDGDSANLGSYGDSTQVYFPIGSIEEADGDGESLTTITNTAGAGAGAAPAAFDEVGQPLFAPAAYPGYRSPALPAAAVSDLYSFSLPSGDNIKSGQYATMGIEYNTSTGDTTQMNVFYYDTTTGYWRKEPVERNVNQGEGQTYTLRANLNHFSDFVVINSNPVAPGAVTVTPASSGELTVSWTAGTPATDNVTSGAMADSTTGYNVYRSTTSGSGYVKVNSSILPSSQTSYTDTGLLNGTTYYYVVRGVHGTATNESEKSPENDGEPEAGASISGGEGGSSWYGCAIATASYGSPDAENVKILRKFRDRHLLNNWVGREFVDMYYCYSPPIADYIRDKETLRAATRMFLKPLVWYAKRAVE